MFGMRRGRRPARCALWGAGWACRGRGRLPCRLRPRPRNRLGHCPLQGGIVQAGRLQFDDEADPAPLGTVSVGNSSGAATAILALFLLCELSRLRRRPAACNTACEEATSGQHHSHGVLPYWKAAGEDGSSVIHGGLSSSPRSQLGSSSVWPCPLAIHCRAGSDNRPQDRCRARR